MKTNTPNTNTTDAHRAGDTLYLSLSHESAHAQLQLAGIMPGIAPAIVPANDTEPLEDKLHLIKLAQRIRLSSWSGLEEHHGSDREAEYVERCTDSEPQTGITARYIREIGHAKSEIPLPIGARALHLTVTGSLSQRDLELFVHACFPNVLYTMLVYCAPKGALAGTLHVFVLADGGWRPIGPAAWMRARPANDLQVVAGPVSVRAGVAGERASESESGELVFDLTRGES